MIFGKHTVDELSDLLVVWNGQIEDVGNTLESIPSDILAQRDPSLKGDWADFVNRWKQAESSSQTYIKLQTYANPLTSNSVIPAEDHYQIVLKTLNRQYPGQYTDKDYRGLQIRVQKIKNIAWVDRPIPYSTDIDLNMYKAADSGTKVVQAAGAGIVDAAKSNWKPIAIAGGIGLGALIVAHKLKLL